MMVWVLDNIKYYKKQKIFAYLKSFMLVIKAQTHATRETIAPRKRVYHSRNPIIANTS
jgi:hypothetical protein